MGHDGVHQSVGCPRTSISRTAAGYSPPPAQEMSSYSGWCTAVNPHILCQAVVRRLRASRHWPPSASAYKTATAGELSSATPPHLLTDPPPGHTPDASPQPAALKEVTKAWASMLLLTTVSSPCVSLSTSRRPVTNRCKSTGSASTPEEGTTYIHIAGSHSLWHCSHS